MHGGGRNEILGTAYSNHDLFVFLECAVIADPAGGGDRRFSRARYRPFSGRPLDGVRRTDATFWRAGTRVLPGVESRARRRSYRAGWRRLTVRTAVGAAVAEGGHLLSRDPDATARSLQSLWEDRDQALAALETGGIGAAFALAVRWCGVRVTDA